MIERQAMMAKAAARVMAGLSREAKDAALEAIAQALARQQERIAAANREDLAAAEREQITPVLLKRLKFDADKLAGVVAGLRSLQGLADPGGRTLAATELDEGLELYKVSCPIGVLGVVFESRPDALVQISGLALKSGNAVLLKGGSEAARTNKVLAEVIGRAGVEAGLPGGWLGLLETREDVTAMLGLEGVIDLIIPRGSNAFVKYIMEHTRIAVLGHADGICHVYVDRGADLEKALRIAVDAKCQYPAVCNAMETLLVDEAVAEAFLPRAAEEYARAGVALRGDETAARLMGCAAASEQDWATEYNDLVLSVKVVAGLDAAIEHINRYGSRHTDAIVTEDAAAARQFLALVDSGNVFWNCSTRFSDGYRYGLGAEVGISTNKIHARGPVGLEGLVIYKWLLRGRGQVVGDYGPDGRAFTHRRLEKDFEI